MTDAGKASPNDDANDSRGGDDASGNDDDAESEDIDLEGEKFPEYVLATIDYFRKQGYLNGDIAAALQKLAEAHDEVRCRRAGLEHLQTAHAHRLPSRLHGHVHGH